MANTTVQERRSALECLFHAVLSNKFLLRLIFEKIENGSTELRKVRLVSKDWNKIATIVLRENNWMKRNFLRLKGCEDLKKYAVTQTPSMHGNFFNGSWGSAIQFQREQLLFQCIDINLSKQHMLKDKIMEIFFEVHPQCFRSLNLSINMCLNVKKSKNIQQILATQASSLSEFKLCASVCCLDFESINTTNGFTSPTLDEIKLVKLNYFALELKRSYRQERNIPNQQRQYILESYLVKFPKSRKIKMCLLDWIDIDGTIRILQKYDQINNLKILDINHLSHNEELKSLGDAGVKLQFLAAMHFNRRRHFFGESNMHPKLIYEFLCTQVGNLEQLFWGSFWRFKFPAEAMIALKKLKLSCLKYWSFDAGSLNDDQDDSSDEDTSDDEDDEVEHTWHQGCYPVVYDFFPMLEELQLESVHPIPLRMFFKWFLAPQIPCMSVKKLGISYRKVNPEVIKSISSIFTHLTCLELGEIQLESKIEEKTFFETLWNAEFASNLEKFSIILTNSVEQEKMNSHNKEGEWRVHELDSLFSGLSEWDIAEQVQESQSFNIIIFPTDKSILNYRNLKIIKIQESTASFDTVTRRGGQFTEFSLYSIFLKLEKLALLCLPRDMCWFSRKAASQLQQKLNTAQLPNKISGEEGLEHSFGTSFDTLTVAAKLEFQNSYISRVIEFRQDKY